LIRLIGHRDNNQTNQNNQIKLRNNQPNPTKQLNKTPFLKHFTGKAEMRKCFGPVECLKFRLMETENTKTQLSFNRYFTVYSSVTTIFWVVCVHSMCKCAVTL
jgi:hypothetical protein